MEEFHSNIRGKTFEQPFIEKVLAVNESDMSKWEVDVENKLKAYTLLEWGVAVGEPYHVVLRIGYAASKSEWDAYKDTDHSPHQFQTAMSPTAAKELGALLILYAKEIENHVPSKDEQN
ncbi:hypothetical protein [Rhizobium herbae]|uniref:Uncharacterized protein n=1 Tax=Rhizobium herbae TaxID=508661 RepID=A0ABS4EWZ8_9HYPH|nr:hypothetical protein [Rhizobium herbae]MBP1862311.1 hypothetical protein [Rhizobium herbae]